MNLFAVVACAASWIVCGGKLIDDILHNMDAVISGHQCEPVAKQWRTYAFESDGCRWVVPPYQHSLLASYCEYQCGSMYQCGNEQGFCVKDDHIEVALMGGFRKQMGPRIGFTSERVNGKGLTLNSAMYIAYLAVCFNLHPLPLDESLSPTTIPKLRVHYCSSKQRWAAQVASMTQQRYATSKRRTIPEYPEIIYFTDSELGLGGSWFVASMITLLDGSEYLEDVALQLWKEMDADEQEDLLYQTTTLQMY